MNATRPSHYLLGFLCFLCLPAAAQELGRATIEWAPDGRVLISASGLLGRFDLDADESDAKAQQLLDDTGLTFALCGAELAVALVPPALSRVEGSGVEGGEGRLELRSYPDFEPIAELSLTASPPQADAPGSHEESATPTGEVIALACSPNAQALAGGTDTGHLLLWELADRELWADLEIQPPAALTRLAFSADGARLLSAYADGRAVLWDVEKRDVVLRLEPPRPADPNVRDPGPNASVAALSPDGRRLLVNRLRGEDTEMYLYDDAGRVLWHRGGYGLEFTPDGSGVLALAAPFRIAALYRVENADALRVFEPPRGVEQLFLVRARPDGTRLVGVGRDAAGDLLVLWDFATARVLATRR
jgi:WD40 repeat protein